MKMIFCLIRRFFCLGLYFLLFFLSTCTTPVATYYDPEPLFLNPPQQARPGVLWVWMGSNITKEGITADLEALKEAGFGKATMSSLSDVTIPWSMVIKKSPTPQITTGSEAWWQLVKFAASECERLGIEFGMFNCPGYGTSGGNWITPEKSMQELCWTETWVWGQDTEQALTLPRPIVNPVSQMPFPVYDTSVDSVRHVIIPARNTCYKDIAILAMPVTGVVRPSRIMVLTDRLDSNGVLHWRPPPGQWSVYRFGHTTTGAVVQPAQPQVAGLECDKMSAEAVGYQMDHVIADLQHNLGRQIGTIFTHLFFDSYEAGDPSWTPKMPEEFFSRRGYNLLSYLPVFAGRTVQSYKITSRFLTDFDHTIRDLYRDNYFKEVSHKMKQAGLKFMCEPYGGPWQIEEVAPYVHFGTAEFWTTDNRFTPYATVETIKALQAGAQNIIEAEAFTGKPAFSKWSEYPAQLKPIGDEAFCTGINRLILHRYVHQPWASNYLPGNTMGQWGTHFDRTQTWWKPAKAMVKYWQRCQALLQWGHPVEKTENAFTASPVSSGVRIDYAHRQQGATHVYFVANLEQQAGEVKCSFEVSGSQPEVWNPVTGEINDHPGFQESRSRTTLSIPFAPGQSYFVVFRKKRKESKPDVAQKPKVITTLNNPWKVTFDSKWGGPDTAVTFKTLTDWSASPQKGIKYYSGTAVYTTTFAAPLAVNANRNLYLHLGQVNHIASVVLNGTDLGVVWTAPWQVKLPPDILKASNTLQVSVTNEWANRLIGDEQEPQDAEWGNSQYSYPSGQYLKTFPEWFLKGTNRPSPGRYCFTTWNYFSKDSSLLPSGLIGPVRLLSEAP